jgi:hypothetical protein
MESNINSILNARSLSKEMLELIEKGWINAKDSCAPYHR